MAMAQVMNTYILVHVKSLISHWTTCVRVAGLCSTLENGPVCLFMSPLSTSVDRSCFLINNAFVGTEGTECSPVLPYQHKGTSYNLFFQSCKNQKFPKEHNVHK